MDFSGPLKIQVQSRKKYILVIVDDYSRFTWTMFLKLNSERVDVLMTFFKMTKTKLNCLIVGIRSDCKIGYKNVNFDVFCE